MSQARVLLELTEYSLRNRGRFPTMREAMELCGMSSPSVPRYFIDILVQEGYIGVDPAFQGDKNRYYIRGITPNPPHWYYKIKAQYIDKQREVLDVDWNVELEKV